MRPTTPTPAPLAERSTLPRPARSAVALVVAALAALAAGPSLRAADAPAVESTGRIDLSIEPPIPEVALPLALGADEKPALVEGKATPTTYLLYSFSPPPGRLFELRLFAPEEAVAMIIFKAGSKTPESGATAKDQAVMWMSSVEEPQELRILVRGQVAGETPFKLGAKLYPKED